MRFVLVHGGCHGAWCWERLIPELADLGHVAIAMDLPGHGERRAENDWTLAGYRDAVLEVLREGDVLVGHSMGGLVATVAADASPSLVSHIVYLASGPPVEGQPLMGLPADLDLKAPPSAGSLVEFSGGGRFFGCASKEVAIDSFYHDCAPEIQDWAFERLVPESVEVVMGTPISVPTFWAADLPRSYILCTEDRAVSPQRARAQAGRLGVVPFEIASSHSPFLSRPAELARMLVEAVGTKPYRSLDPTGNVFEAPPGAFGTG